MEVALDSHQKSFSDFIALVTMRVFYNLLEFIIEALRLEKTSEVI